MKPSNLPVTKVREFLHSKPSYTKITLATRKFNRFRAFVKFKDNFWCMDLAYVDKLAKDNNGVKYLLVRQNVFDGNVHAKEMKAKDCKETVRAFLTIITERIDPQEIGSTRDKKLLESLKNIAKLKDYNFSLQ